LRRACCALILATAALYSRSARAEGGTFLEVTGGIGLSSPDTMIPGGGQGVYARADLLPWRDSWFTPKAYSGFLITVPSGDCGVGVSPCDVSAQILFLGGAARLMLPIPYVGPFVEVGLGLSIGRMSTRSGADVNLQWSGVTYHVPFALGLAFGKQHEYELSFQYMDHPDQHQVTGGIAVGFGFQLDTPRSEPAEPIEP